MIDPVWLASPQQVCQEPGAPVVIVGHAEVSCRDCFSVDSARRSAGLLRVCIKWAAGFRLQCSGSVTLFCYGVNSHGQRPRSFSADPLVSTIRYLFSVVPNLPTFGKLPISGLLANKKSGSPNRTAAGKQTVFRANFCRFRKKAK